MRVAVEWNLSPESRAHKRPQVVREYGPDAIARLTMDFERSASERVGSAAMYKAKKSLGPVDYFQWVINHGDVFGGRVILLDPGNSALH